MTYQGWTNKETWAIALTLDNTQTYFLVALDIIQRTKETENASVLLFAYVSDLKRLNKKDTEDLQELTLKDANWKELVNHYKTKIKEGN